MCEISPQNNRKNAFFLFQEKMGEKGNSQQKTKQKILNFANFQNLQTREEELQSAEVVVAAVDKLLEEQEDC